MINEKYIVGKQLTDSIKKLILNAEKYVKISSFLMQDNEIKQMLKELSSSGKIAVFLLSNKKDQESEEYIDSMHYKQKEAKENSIGFDNHGKFLKELFYSGIHVRLLDNLHAKFIIADGDKGLIMSANLAPNSLKKNVESGIELSNKDVKELEYVFDLMYKHADIIRYQGAYRKDVTVKVNNKLNPQAIAQIEGNIRLTVASSYESNLDQCKVYSIYESIIDIINKAQNYLYIVTYHFKFKGDVLDEFMDAIRRAIRRGVTVFLYSNTKTIVPSLQASLRVIKELTKIGCRSFGDDRNHSKCVLSESEGILFTANIDGVSGLKSGFEVGCMMNEVQRSTAKKHIDEIIKNISYGR